MVIASLGIPVQMLLQTVLFCAYLNLKYPRSAVPLGPLIEKLLEEKRATNAEMPSGYEGLYHFVCGPDAPRHDSWAGIPLGLSHWPTAGRGEFGVFGEGFLWELRRLAK